MTRTTPWALLVLLAGCGHTEVQDTPGHGTSAVAVRCQWTPDSEDFAGEPLLLGGILCVLSHEDGGAIYEELTEPGKPLVFDPVEPGDYDLVLKGRDAQGAEKTYDAPGFEVRRGHLVTVVLTMSIPDDVASAAGRMEWLGDRTVNVLTAPLRFTGEVLSASEVEEDPFALQEDPSASSPDLHYPGGERNTDYPGDHQE